MIEHSDCRNKRCLILIKRARLAGCGSTRLRINLALRSVNIPQTTFRGEVSVVIKTGFIDQDFRYSKSKKALQVEVQRYHRAVGPRNMATKGSLTLDLQKVRAEGLWLQVLYYAILALLLSLCFCCTLYFEYRRTPTLRLWSLYFPVRQPWASCLQHKPHWFFSSLCPSTLAL